MKIIFTEKLPPSVGSTVRLANRQTETSIDLKPYVDRMKDSDEVLLKVYYPEIYLDCSGKRVPPKEYTLHVHRDVFNDFRGAYHNASEFLLSVAASLDMDQFCPWSTLLEIARTLRWDAEDGFTLGYNWRIEE